MPHRWRFFNKISWSTFARLDCLRIHKNDESRWWCIQALLDYQNNRLWNPVPQARSLKTTWPISTTRTAAQSSRGGMVVAWVGANIAFPNVNDTWVSPSDWINFIYIGYCGDSINWCIAKGMELNPLFLLKKHWSCIWTWKPAAFQFRQGSTPLIPERLILVGQWCVPNSWLTFLQVLRQRPEQDLSLNQDWCSDSQRVIKAVYHREDTTLGDRFVADCNSERERVRSQIPGNTQRTLNWPVCVTKIQIANIICSILSRDCVPFSWIVSWYLVTLEVCSG